VRCEVEVGDQVRQADAAQRRLEDERVRVERERAVDVDRDLLAAALELPRVQATVLLPDADAPVTSSGSAASMPW
jgi:hypothetical protein